nr:hypothetical protein [uncultured Anaerostipes sp.]
MKEICIGVCCRDTRYGKRLMEYLNHQKEFPMTACFFAEETALWKKEQEGMFQCLVLSEEMPDCGRSPICRLKEGEYGSAADIAEKIYECLRVRKKEEWLVYGIYSPFGGQASTAFALELARKKSLIYMGMQPYLPFASGEEATDELLFRIRQRQEDCMDYFVRHQERLGEIKGYPGAGCFLDYRELTTDDCRWFLEQLREEGISVVIDIGTACVPSLDFFRILDKIYLPVTEQELKTELYAGFLKQMRRYSLWGCSGMEEVIICGRESIREVVAQL